MFKRFFLRWAAWLALLGAAIGGTSVAHSTSAEAPMTIKELTGGSDLLIHGRVGSLASSKEGQRIFTTIHLAAIEALKGTLTADGVTLKLYGGSYEGKRTIVVGGPTFDPGEEVVVFLKRNGPDDTYGVLGLAQGKFRIVREANRPATVSRDLRGITFHDERSLEHVPQTWDELKTAIRAAGR